MNETDETEWIYHSEWMKQAALRANSREGTRKLSNFDKRKSKHLNGFLWIHFGRVLLEIFRKISWMNAKAVYWTSVTVSTFRRWKSVDENGLRCVTKEKYSLALHYKQFTAWFLRDIWHKYCSWYFKMVLNITHGSGSWYQGQF